MISLCKKSPVVFYVRRLNKRKNANIKLQVVRSNISMCSRRVHVFETTDMVYFYKSHNMKFE